MRKLFSIPDEKETRLWNKYMSNTFEPLNKPDSTIQDAGLYQGQVRRCFKDLSTGRRCFRRDGNEVFESAIFLCLSAGSGYRTEE